MKAQNYVWMIEYFDEGKWWFEEEDCYKNRNRARFYLSEYRNNDMPYKYRIKKYIREE